MRANGLEAAREAFEGGVPSMLSTCAADGTPNITLVSQVEYVDRSHVALSFQFFNKTRENILANPSATVLLTHPETAQMWRLKLRYLRTESAGPLFERMRAKLAGIASHTGMAGVFKLRGADLYRVAAIEALPGPLRAVAQPSRDLLPALRLCTERLARCSQLDQLFDECLSGLDREFGFQHALLMITDESGRRLYTVASRGYEGSGVGSEVAFGEGVIGVAARECTGIRIAHATSEYAYGRAVRAGAEQAGLAGLGEEIPFPGLIEPHSQLAVPLVDRGSCLGVLCVESRSARRFGPAEEDALTVLAAQLAARIALLRAETEEQPDSAPVVESPPRAQGDAVELRRYLENDSVFIGQDYLIKGVAGAILWTLLHQHATRGRCDFSNRELRLDRGLRLPDIADNLETRLILLSRRLAERCPYIGIEKTGRGRFRLRVDRPLQLIEVPKS